MQKRTSRYSFNITQGYCMRLCLDLALKQIRCDIYVSFLNPPLSYIIQDIVVRVPDLSSFLMLWNETLKPLNIHFLYFYKDILYSWQCYKIIAEHIEIEDSSGSSLS